MSSVADQYGFFWETLWNHEQNQGLREQRGNPNVLMAGDRVFIPEVRPKQEPCSTTQRHVFRLKGVPAKVVFRLLKVDGTPRGGLPYILVVDGKRETGTVPEDGRISQVVPPKARKAKLTVQDPAGAEEYNFDLGYLNPSESSSGLKARLANLGFYRGNLSGGNDEQTAEAIRRFQVFAGLPVTGEADEATKNALAERHGS